MGGETNLIPSRVFFQSLSPLPQHESTTPRVTTKEDSSSIKLTATFFTRRGGFVKEGPKLHVTNPLF